MAGLTITHELSVRFRDCDAYQHVNNAVYLTYLEEARAAWFFEAMGGPARADRFPFILASVHVDYKAPARYRQALAIDVSVGEVRNRSFTLNYTVRAGAELVAEASTVQVTYDYSAGTPIAIPADLRRALLDGSPV